MDIIINGKEIIKFKAKDFEIVEDLRQLFHTNMERVGLYGSVYDFSVDYNAIAVDDIREIQWKRTI